MAKSAWIDISLPLNANMRVLPPLPTPVGEAPNPVNAASRVYRFFDVDKGDKVTMSRIEMDSHDGTHLDAPLHFIPGGMTIDAMPIETTCGPCRVIEIKNEKDITVADLEPYKIKSGERILFKTKNSPHVYSIRQYMGDWVALVPETAEYLVEKKIRMVGLDYLTVGHTDPPDVINKVHRALLSNGIFILEAINLAGVKPGNYDMMCLPLRIEKGDAGPCRVVIRARK
jgi:arylformamidase